MSVSAAVSSCSSVITSGGTSRTTLGSAGNASTWGRVRLRLFFVFSL